MKPTPGQLPQESTAQSGPSLLLYVAMVPTVLAVLLASLGPIVSGDLWWHIRTGKWILDEGRLPTTDPFSHTAGDTPWVLQEYGSQIVLAVVHNLGGFAGIKALTALLSLTILLAIWKRARVELQRPWAALFTCLFALLFALKWELRPHLFSLLLFLGLERVLFTYKGAPSLSQSQTPGLGRIAVLFGLSALWVQLHAEALFAPLLALAVCTGAAIGAGLEKRGLRHAFAWLGMFAAALLGTMASPLFLAPHRYALLGRGVPQDFIEEWFRPWVLPLDPRFQPVTTALFVAFWATLLIGAVFVLGRLRERLATPPTEAPQREQHLSWERLAFLAGCMLFALSARRFFWLAWFPFFDMAAFYLRCSRDRLGDRQSERLENKWAPLAAAALLGCLLLPTHYPSSALSSLRSGKFAAVVDTALFPTHAADFAVSAGLQGNLYNPYEWGGYLGWKLGLAAPVYIDARTVLFEQVIVERWRAERDGAFRAEAFERRAVDLVVFKHFVDHGQGVRPWTPNAPGANHWIRAWTDQLAVIWVRRGSPNATHAIEHWDSLGVAMDSGDGITEAAIAAAQPAYLRNFAMLPKDFLERLEEAQQLARDAPHAREQHIRLARAVFWARSRMKRNARDELSGLAKFLSTCDEVNLRIMAPRIEAGLSEQNLDELLLWLGEQFHTP